MATRKPQRALISVYDKTGIVDFARALHQEFGIEIISTGGTATLLTDAEVPVTLVEDVTGCPALLDGRVKTLHPKIHAAILADRDNPDHMRQLDEQGIKPIDMVVVNLYPFEKTVADPDCTFEQAIEMIDIGGVTLLRAAAKNHKHVLVVSSPEQYGLSFAALREPVCIDPDQRLEWAMLAYQQTQGYETAIEEYLSSRHFEGSMRRLNLDSVDPEALRISDPIFKGKMPVFARWSAGLSTTLRYGENPHQVGGVYYPIGDWEGAANEESLAQAKTLQGKMSFNNFADSHAALDVCSSLAGEFGDQSVVVFVKHMNACGVAKHHHAVEAYRKAYLGDPNAAMGGVLAVNFTVDETFAEHVMDTYQRWGKEAAVGGFFLEVWLAPGFSMSAIRIIQDRRSWGRRVRLLPVQNMLSPQSHTELEIKSIRGGLLAQTPDVIGLNEGDWKVATKREPTDAEMDDLRLAWLVCKHTKSNAISICKDGMLIGNGAGQMSRVMSCRIATWLANENGHADQLAGAVAASDAFFPFRDGPDLLVDAGVTAIIQPGGSKRDQEVIDACNEREVAMILTGTRHFKH